MKKLNKTSWLSLVFLTAAASASADPRIASPDDQTCAHSGSPAVLVHVVGLKNGAGTVRVQAYGPGGGAFLQKGKWASRVDVTLAGRRNLDICLPLASAGEYAIAVRHDANGNHKSDWNDGAGFSRNPRLSILGRPNFAQTAIPVQRGATRLSVVMNYRQGFSVGPIG